MHPDQLAALALDPDLAEDDDRTHLDDCARCRREVATLRAVSERAKRAQPDEVPPAPPETIWDSVVAELSASDDLPPPAAERSRPFVLQHSFALAAVLVALVVIAAAVVLLPSRGGGGGAVVAEAALEPLTDVPAARATLVLDEEQRTLRIDTEALPEIDGYYELWLLTADASGLVSLGPVESGQRYDIPSTLDTSVYSVVDISREPLDGDPAHSADSVLRGPLVPTA